MAEHCPDCKQVYGPGYLATVAQALEIAGLAGPPVQPGYCAICGGPLDGSNVFGNVSSRGPVLPHVQRLDDICRLDPDIVDWLDQLTADLGESNV